MHLLIAHAAPSGPQCQAALGRLQLPHLGRLLQRLAPGPAYAGSPDDFTPLHERLHAQALGLEGADGLLPWAARDARQQGLPGSSQSGDSAGWAWITPCHWQVNADHVEMLDPQDLALSADESGTLMDAMRAYFAEDGITLYPLNAGTWLAHGDVFKGLPTASLERTRGTTVDRWLPRQPQARPLRRLQNEMQMLLYTHPLNDARLARRQTPISSFWVSGTGDLPAGFAPSGVTAPTPTTSLIDRLRAPALRDDAPAWLEAWHALDGSLLADALHQHDLQVSLCGEHHACTLSPHHGPWWSRLQRRFTAPAPAHWLATL